jgi:hypothetical protein
MKDDWLAIDVRIKAVAMVMMILSLASPAVHGDFATPFMEINNKVGDVSTAHCYIVAISHSFFPVHLVIVDTDTSEHVVIKATVAREIVKTDLLGRPVIVKAQTVAPTKSNYHTTLKILSMEPWGRPKDAGIAEERSEQSPGGDVLQAAPEK